MSDCGKWLIVEPVLECIHNLVYFTKLPTEITGKLPLTQIVKKFEADYKYIGNCGPKAIFKSNKDAPNGKLEAINLENYQDDSWEVLVPEHYHNVMVWARVVDQDKLVICYMEHVKVNRKFCCRR